MNELEAPQIVRDASARQAPRRFFKYEGLGNDFVVVEADSETAVDPEYARRLCDRHFGVGADGVLVLLPPSTAQAAARMTVINADGSRPEMCGNGIRCLALHLARRQGAQGASYVIDTDAGSLLCEVHRDGDSARVAVAMGHGEFLGEHFIELDGLGHAFARISMGNPHCVIFDTRYDETTIDRYGPLVSLSLEGGSNVEFATTRGPRAFDLVVWERGVGRTLACGTGAAATAVAAALCGRAPFDEPLSVVLPGGPLEVSVAHGSLDVRVAGPARLVYQGELA
jgi:diaminopimelate epimerase